MDLTQIETNLAHLFNTDNLWPHQGRRLVFWYDPEGEFFEDYKQITLDGVEKLHVNGAPFQAKVRLHIEHPDTPFLVYLNADRPAPRENWLLGLEKTALHYTADRAAMVFQQLGLRDRTLEAVLHERLAFFDNKQRVAALERIGLSPDATESELLLALMSATLGLQVASPDLVLRHVLSGGLDETNNDAYQTITKFAGDDAFWNLAQSRLGFASEKHTLEVLFNRLVLTHLWRDIGDALPERYQDQLLPASKAGAAYVLVQQWMRDSTAYQRFDEIGRNVAANLGIRTAFEALEPEAYLVASTFRDLHKVFLRKTIDRLLYKRIDREALDRWIDARRALPGGGYGEHSFGAYYDALEAASALLEKIPEAKTRVSQAAAKSAEAVFYLYADELSRVDRFYRHYVEAAEHCDPSVLKELTDILENAYVHGYLEPINGAWSETLEPLDAWQIPGLTPQERFFKRTVEPAVSDGAKVVVIVSDALRYEMAADWQQSSSLTCAARRSWLQCLESCPAKRASAWLHCYPARGSRCKMAMSLKRASAREAPPSAPRYLPSSRACPQPPYRRAILWT